MLMGIKPVLRNAYETITVPPQFPVQSQLGSIKWTKPLIDADGSIPIHALQA